MNDTQRKLLDLQVEAERLADENPLGNLSAIRANKAESERLAATLTEAQRQELSDFWFTSGPVN